MSRKQLSVPGTEPVEHYPEVRKCLDAWLDAVESAKQARDAAQSCHDDLLDAIVEAGIPYYSYDAEGKRKRVYPTVADPKLKTTVVGPVDGGRRGRERDVAMPIDKARAKAVDALGGDVGEAVEVDAVEHRRVARSSVAAELDPFSHVRSLLDEAAAKPCVSGDTQ